MVGIGTARFGACRVGACRATAAAANPGDSPGDPAQAQPKTIAATANVSRGLREEVGTEEKERRAAKRVMAQPQACS